MAMGKHKRQAKQASRWVATSSTTSAVFITTSAQPASKYSALPAPPTTSQVEGRTIVVTCRTRSAPASAVVGFFHRSAGNAFSAGPVVAKSGTGVTRSATENTLLTSRFFAASSSTTR